MRLSEKQWRQAKEEYAYERAAREKILHSEPGAERQHLFFEAYEGLARGVREKIFLHTEERAQAKAFEKAKLIRRYARKDADAAEFGPGEGDLAGLIGPRVRKLWLVDVADSVKRPLPKHAVFTLYDGVRLPEDIGNLGLVYSSHVFEHLHPEDVSRHLRRVRDALVVGGTYIIFTPHRYAGPHDVSRFFSLEAEGLHLKEYTYREIIALARAEKFFVSAVYVGGKGVYMRLPLASVLCIEYLLGFLPRRLQRRVAGFLPLRACLGIILVLKK